MRTRVTIALTGVLALAILRAAAFISPAAGATLLTWVQIPALLWFTWSVWLVILAIGGGVALSKFLFLILVVALILALVGLFNRSTV